MSTILNVKPNGPLDSGGFVVPLAQAIPQPAVTVLIEVESLRHGHAHAEPCTMNCPVAQGIARHIAQAWTAARPGFRTKPEP